MFGLGAIEPFWTGAVDGDGKGWDGGGV
jgi:hypothetical protein